MEDHGGGRFELLFASDLIHLHGACTKRDRILMHNSLHYSVQVRRA